MSVYDQTSRSFERNLVAQNLFSLKSILKTIGINDEWSRFNFSDQNQMLFHMFIIKVYSKKRFTVGNGKICMKDIWHADPMKFPNDAHKGIRCRMREPQWLVETLSRERMESAYQRAKILERTLLFFSHIKKSYEWRSQQNDFYFCNHWKNSTRWNPGTTVDIFSCPSIFQT